MVAVRNRDGVRGSSLSRGGAYGRSAEQALCALLHSPHTPPSTSRLIYDELTSTVRGQRHLTEDALTRS